jgi:hypothetical protein
MAFDYGSIDLGLRNPFKKEGKVTAIRGGIQLVIGLYLLLRAAASVREDAGLGWILVLFGILLLGDGIRVLTGGIFATLRYFVGRNHPTSLALNFSRSEASNAKQEEPYVAYTKEGLEEMMMGRKNFTFVEPQGFLARLLHSLLPKLLFMPYPLRNMAQRVFGAWVKTATALMAYALVAFVSLAGFAGEAGRLAFPVYSLLLTIYLMFIWYRAGTALSRAAEKTIDSLGGGDLVRVISVAIVLPVVIGVALSFLMSSSSIGADEISAWLGFLPQLHTLLYLLGILLLAAIGTTLLAALLRERLTLANPVTEVSELRENWQESVHPNEIFINLDNLVMANRRYKEVPNRVYVELDPKLHEQVEGKGGFKGQMIQEIQPRVTAMNTSPLFDQARFIGLLAGNGLHLVAVLLLFLLAYAVVAIYQFVTGGGGDSLQLMDLVMSAVHLFLSAFILRAFGNLMANAAHLFYAEIQFESLLIYFKCEGTFTESKISTGTGIHDSTRSENTLVRSSITPWIIVTRIVSTTYAATGMRNLEHPRHILEMHKADQELQSIRQDVISFLKDRESIASITSTRDLGNASQIYQLNQQTRAGAGAAGLEHQQRQNEEAAGYLRQQKDMKGDPESSF